jgi:hypothetical protein
METEPNRAINRAKLYLLDDENEWLDQGTGFPLIETTSVKTLIFFSSNPFYEKKRKNAVFLKFFSEETSREIYSFEINENIFFERKEGRTL